MDQSQGRRSIDELAEAAGWTGSINQGRDWDTVERALGLTLPEDYKAMMSRFPSGFFRNAVWITNPIDARVDLGTFLREDVHEVVESFSGENGDFMEDTNYALFPAPGGLLPWGNDLQGGKFFWLTKGIDPNEWPVVYWSRDLFEWTEHDSGVVDAIMKILTCAGDDNIIRMDLGEEESIFRVPSTYMGNGGWLPHEEYR
ncbi:SUKH superfamily protein [Amycolatopsis sulphurea]|uniref:SUKH superfamily protein n=1 Tax=Amycolatopsis sulphurea TaxID=76022 RepID=A0A2A9FJI3_9PSEU|nr:SMI1/KNR4 family protein [Amycolatopsis sulphurea]PFG50722.1 SUKH superfamily protein [Amycolatopsis sulphurea]